MVFIFASSAGGIRIADLLTLQKANIDGDYLDYTTRKNIKKIRLWIPYPAREILSRYLGVGPQNRDWIFPILNLDAEETADKKVHSAIQSATSKINRGLKEIAKLAGVSKRLSSHQSRHYFCTHAISMGERLEVVSAILGHSDLATTQGYARVLDKVKTDAMKRLQ